MSQTSGTRQVLVCENPERPGMGIAAHLLQYTASHHFQIIKATNHDAVHALLLSHPIALVVIDMGRDCGEALVIIRSICMRFPSLPLFVFNGFMIPGIAEKAQEYDHVQYCEVPSDLPRFLSLILEDISAKKRGIIRGIFLSNFLDWMNAMKLNGQIIVKSGDKKGVLYLKEGQLIGAEMGTPQNPHALAEMSSWEKVTVEIKEEPSLGRKDRDDGLAAPAAPRRLPDRMKTGRLQEQNNTSIDILRIIRDSKTLSVHIKELQMAVASIRDLLQESLLGIDIFLSANGRTLAGWNSLPMAGSAFAGITRSLINSLEVSRFPPIGNYYMFELSNDTLMLMVIGSELHMGLLVTKSTVLMGLLTNIILPQAIKALNKSVTVEKPK